MSECLVQLDAILRIASEELEALSAGDLDMAEQLCATRNELTSKAMSIADTAPPSALIERLIALQQAQKRLYDEAYRNREDIRSQLSRSKQEGRRLNGYRKAVHMGL